MESRLILLAVCMTIATLIRIFVRESIVVKFWISAAAAFPIPLLGLIYVGHGTATHFNLIDLLMYAFGSAGLVTMVFPKRN